MTLGQVYVAGERRWHALIGQTATGWETPVNCYLYFEEFSTLGGGNMGLRRCRQNLIRTCDPAWPVLSDRVKCSAYTWIVKYSEPAANDKPVRYKNPHCALCNHRNTSECNVQPFTTTPPRPVRYAVSAAVLFDFYGEQVGVERACG
ncbi:uncharacterized protein LOC119113445 [Pollicipes pollicipes]|uniref:uncharacterized protein LOC119113445 n=1 Tax=Pollicipes pollicipes TaxID=41117 RepID=UPI00188593A6|nr:uncharacterized protein LOC119113445 [Pollicipes pollicipes]